MPSVLPIIIASVVLPIVIIAVVMGTLMRKQAQTNQLLQTGMPARGRILQLGHTGGSVAVMGHRHLKLMLTCEVHPQAGAPYTATFEQLVSELQLGSIQPGAQVELRVDPANPTRIALASVIPAGMQQQQQQQGAWGSPGSFGAAPIAMGVAQPNYKSSLPMILIMLFITTVPIGVIMLYTFGGFSGFGSFGGGSKSDDKGSDTKSGNSAVCEQAKKCCQVVTPGSDAACSNYQNMPEEGCKTALDALKNAAKTMKRTCD